MLSNIHHEINDVFQQELLSSVEPNDVSGLFNGISTLSKKCDSAKSVRDTFNIDINMESGDVSTKVKARNLANSFFDTSRNDEQPADNTYTYSDNKDMI